MGDRASISNGVLTILVGCNDIATKRAVWPLLERYGSFIQHMGGLGCGTAAKLSLNMLHMSLDVLLGEALTLGVKSGLELETLLKALDAVQLLGPSASIYRRFPQTLFKGEFLPSKFYLNLAYKDYRLAAELASRHQVPTRLISMCEQEHLEALSKGWGAQERVINLTLQEERARVKLRTSLFGEEQTPSWMPQRDGK